MGRSASWLGCALAACITLVGCGGVVGQPQAVGDGGPLMDGLVGGGAAEVCGNGLDDDGDGDVDEQCSCTADAEQACYPGPVATRDVSPCRPGTQRCVAADEFSWWGECHGAVTPTAEVCGDEIDNNCDGIVDNCDVPCSPISCPDGCCDAQGKCQLASQTTCGLDGAQCQVCAEPRHCKNGRCQSPVCGPSSCPDGCCDDRGRCRPTQNATCGVAGAQCRRCGTLEVCQAGSCKRGTDPCGPSSCPDGCCDDQGVCRPSSASSCGLAGASCKQCDAPATCQAGRCQTGSGSCSPASCPHGCCDDQGICRPSSASSCGLSGASCKQCDAPASCQAGRCQTGSGSCGPASCPDGCCDDQGVCQPSNVATCGTGGASCKRCAQAQLCPAGQCTAPPPPKTYRVIAVNARINNDRCRKQFLDYDNCDIYLKVWVGSLYGKTGTDGDTDKPSWNDLLFTATDQVLLVNPMKVEFWDDDSLVWGSDDKVSSCLLKITAAHLSAGVITTTCDRAKHVTIAFRQ